MSDNTEFWNDRRPSPHRDEDAGTPLGYHTLRRANRDILDATPEYKRSEMRTRIRTNAVHRYRGKTEFSDIAEYKNFISGTDE